MSVAVKIPDAEGIRSPPEIGPGVGEFHRRIGSISRQSAVYFAGTILTAAAGYLFKIYLARRLGAEALGLYALGMSIVGFMGLFNAVGLPTAAARFVAEYSTRGELARLGGFLRGGLALLSVGNLLLGAVVLVAGPWVAVHFYHAPALRSYCWAFALIMLFGVLTTFLAQVMAGYRDVARRTVITHFIGTPVNIVAAVLLISLGFGLGGYLVAQVASAMLVLGLLAVSVWRMTPAEARGAGTLCGVEGKVVAFSAAAFGLAAIDFALSQTDKIVLGCYLAPKEVGIYAVAMALVGFVPIALQSVNQIFSPMIAELHAGGNRILLQKLYATLTKWIVILTIPLALTIAVFARPLMDVFGSGFRPGAAMASAITVATTNMGSLAAVRRSLKLFPYHAGYLKLALPTLISGAILLALMHIAADVHSPWKVAVSGMVCAYVSFLGTLVMSGLDSEDRRFMQMAWAKIMQSLRRD